MKYRLIILFIALCSFAHIQAQNTTDGINRIKNADERYVAAKDLIEYYQINNIDSLKIFAEELALDVRDERFHGLKEYVFSDYYYEMYELGVSLNHALDAIFIYESLDIKDNLILCKSYSMAGLCSEQLYRYEKALEYYVKAMSLAEKLDDKIFLSELYSNRSFVYYGMGDFSSAIISLEEAVRISEELRDTVNISKDLNNLGFIYSSWGKYDTGIEYYQEALDISLAYGLEERSAICSNNIGMSYFSQGKYDLAEEYILQALEIDKIAEAHLNIAKRYNNLGLVYFYQGDVDKSIKHFELAAEVFLEKGDSINYAKSIINIADTYFKTDLNAEAFQYLEKGYNISLRTNSLPLIEHNTEKMYNYYKSIGDYEQALEYKELFDELEDSLYSIESAKVVEEMETLYKTEQKEEEINRLNSESALKEDVIKRKNQQRNLMAAFAIVLFLGLVVIVFVSIKIRKQSRELAKLNNVKNRLFAIISHDLRSYSGVFQDAGMVIRHHVKKENYDKVKSISENLEISALSYSSQLDNILSWSTLQLNGYQISPVEFSPYSECNILIKNLSESQKLKGNQFENNIDRELIINMDKGAFNIIIRNLLANSNKFTEQGIISIGLEKSEKGFKIIVSDTGVGMDEETRDSIFTSETMNSQRGTRGEKGSGVGLGLVKTFVKLSRGNIHVESTLGKGTKFILDFS